jgi:hypothetical protein
MGVTSGIVNSLIDGVIAVLGYATGVAVVGVFFAACRAGRVASAVFHVAERVAAHLERTLVGATVGLLRQQSSPHRMGLHRSPANP